MNRNTIFIVLGLVVALVVAAGVWWSLARDGIDEVRIENNERVVREVATEFGTRLQEVFLTASVPEAREDVREQYADLVAPELLVAWLEDPTEAPGRDVSSPWPDRIEITTVTPLEADAYQVLGRIIYVTSDSVAGGGTAGTEDVRLIVERRGGVWLIAKFSIGPEPTIDPETEPAG